MAEFNVYDVENLEVMKENLKVGTPIQVIAFGEITVVGTVASLAFNETTIRVVLLGGDSIRITSPEAVFLNERIF